MFSGSMSCRALLIICLWGWEAWAMHTKAGREDRIAVPQSYKEGQMTPFRVRCHLHTERLLFDAAHSRLQKSIDA